jgi:hypothetical protein
MGRWRRISKGLDCEQVCFLNSFTFIFLRIVESTLEQARLLNQCKHCSYNFAVFE